ncbi:8860_t:CDS:1, partial [Funneliformis mosseae]
MYPNKAKRPVTSMLQVRHEGKYPHFSIISITFILLKHFVSHLRILEEPNQRESGDLIPSLSAVSVIIPISKF